MWTIWCTGSNRPCPPCWACWASGGTPSTLPTSSANWPCVCAAPRSLSSALHRVSCTRHAPRATCDASTESLSWDSHVAETIPRSHTNGKRRSVHKVEVCPALTICNYILYMVYLYISIKFAHATLSANRLSWFLKDINKFQACWLFY